MKFKVKLLQCQVIRIHLLKQVRIRLLQQWMISNTSTFKFIVEEKEEEPNGTDNNRIEYDGKSYPVSGNCLIIIKCTNKQLNILEMESLYIVGIIFSGS